jgi:hypothetical protein
MANLAPALENLRIIRSAAERLQDTPLQQSLLDLQGQLLSLEVAVFEQQVENRALQAEVNRLAECRNIDHKLERCYGAYMLVQGPHDRQGPFCVACWDRRQWLQTLVPTGRNVGYCPSCKSEPIIGEVDTTVGRCAG